MTPTRYRKKPVVIEAFKFTPENGPEVAEWCDGLASARDGKWISVTISTLEGDMEASPGDFVIKGVKGEFYPCKPDIFEATYEVAE